MQYIVRSGQAEVIMLDDKTIILPSCHLLTQFFLRRSRRRVSCVSHMLRFSCHFFRYVGNRRFWTSETSTAIVTTRSGKSCRCNMYCTSSGVWGKPSKIKPVDLQGGVLEWYQSSHLTFRKSGNINFSFKPTVWNFSPSSGREQLQKHCWLAYDAIGPDILLLIFAKRH